MSYPLRSAMSVAPIRKMQVAQQLQPPKRTSPSPRSGGQAAMLHQTIPGNLSRSTPSHVAAEGLSDSPSPKDGVRRLRRLRPAAHRPPPGALARRRKGGRYPRARMAVLTSAASGMPRAPATFVLPMAAQPASSGMSSFGGRGKCAPFLRSLNNAELQGNTPDDAPLPPSQPQNKQVQPLYPDGPNCSDPARHATSVWQGT